MDISKLFILFSNPSNFSFIFERAYFYRLFLRETDTASSSSSWKLNRFESWFPKGSFLDVTAFYGEYPFEGVAFSEIYGEFSKLRGLINTPEAVCRKLWLFGGILFCIFFNYFLILSSISFMSSFSFFDWFLYVFWFWI